MSALIGETYVWDALPKNETLEEHDKKKHPDGFDPKTDTCKFRERIATETETDKADLENPADAHKGSKTGSDTPQKSLVKPEEDAAYMDAVERGDIGAATRMLKDAAVKHGYTVSAFHGTPTGGFSVFDQRKIGSNTGIGRGAFSFTSNKEMAEKYKNAWDEQTRASLLVSDLNSLLLRHDSPEIRKLFGNDDRDGAVVFDPSIVIGEGALEHDFIEFDEDWKENNPKLYASDEEAKKEREAAYLEGVRKYLVDMLKKTERNNSEVCREFFADAFDMLESSRYDIKPTVYSVFIKTPTLELSADSKDFNKKATEANFGTDSDVSVLHLDNGEDRYFVHDPRAIKSADPVTYDDDGNVIPLSRRFDDGDDIRGDVYGKQTYEEKMKLLHPNLDANEVLSQLLKLRTPDEMAAEFARIMESGKIENDKTVHDELVEALVMDAETLKGQTLQEHDRIHHKDGYHEGDTCKFRDKMKEETPEDQADELNSSRNGEKKETLKHKSLVTNKEDDAYMAAVEKGDMETAAKMVREAAAKAMPETKIVGSDGKPIVSYHFTKAKSGFTVFNRENAGPSMFGKSFYFFPSKKMAENWGNFTGEHRNVMGVYLDIKNPWVDSLAGYDEETGFDKSHINKPSEAAYIALVERLKESGYEIDPNYSYDGMYPYRYSNGQQIPVNHGLAFLSNALTHKTDKGEFGWKYSDAVRKALEDLGYDGVVGELEDMTQIATFAPSQIKSADPVTYDDNGNVIPLSRRFDDWDDIRGDVSGKSEYAEKMKSLHPDINPEELISKLKGLGSREEMEAEVSRILGKK